MDLTREAMVITNGFPFFIRYWREVFNKWESAIDKVYIGLESPMEISTESYLRKILDHPKIVISNGYVEQFNSFTKMFHDSKEDLVLVLHDDTLIFNRKPLDKYFKVAEEGKVAVTIFKGFGPQEYIESTMRRLFPTQVPIVIEETGESDYCFFLPFFFASRKILEKTSAYFGGYSLKKGTYFPPFKTELEYDIGGDTGFLLDCELLANGEHFVGIPYRENTTYDLSRKDNPMGYLKTCKEKSEGLFAADWIHIMSIAFQARTWFRSLKETGGKPHAVESLDFFKEDKIVNEAMMITMAWYYEFLDCDSFEDIKEYRDYVIVQLEFLADRFKLNKEKIREYKNYFHEIVWR